MADLPRLVVFDLDDTLYLERDFALSGYVAAAAVVRQAHGLNGFDEICTGLFEAGERGAVFDRALAIAGIPKDALLVSRLVAIYRAHRPAIALAPDAARWLARGLPFAVITDGVSLTQHNKALALGLPGRARSIRCTGDWGPGFGKPHPRAFNEIETATGLCGADLAYVADNPLKDFLAPRALGWRTVEVARDGRVHREPAPTPAHAAAARITDFDALDEALVAAAPAHAVTV